MVGVQQVVVPPRYPGLKILVLSEWLEDAIRFGEELALSDPYCYMYSPKRHLYELADGFTLQCCGLNDTESLVGKEFDQIFVCGYRALPSGLAHNLLRNSWVPEKFKLQFIKE